MIDKIGSACLLMRTRLISRVITGIYDKHLRDLKISSAQFALLVLSTKRNLLRGRKLGVISIWIDLLLRDT